MMIATLCVPVGAVSHYNGKVADAPSQVYSLGSSPHSATDGLCRLNDALLTVVFNSRMLLVIGAVGWG